MKRRPVYIHHGAHSRVGEPHSDGAHAEEEAGAEDGPSETTRAVATCLQPVRDLAFALVESAWFKGKAAAGNLLGGNVSLARQWVHLRRRPALLHPPSGSLTRSHPPLGAGFWVLAIIAYCIIQCLYAPLQPSDSARNRLVEVSNLAFTIAFTVELLLKVRWGPGGRGARKGQGTVALGLPCVPERLLLQPLWAAAGRAPLAGRGGRGGAPL